MPVPNDAYLEEVSAERFRAARQALEGRVRRTPVWAWPAEEVADWLGDGAELLLKLELWQHAGCFKARGALLHLLSLSADERARGVTAASAGNHAACVAFAARAVGASAKVVVPRTVSPARLAVCRHYGADVLMVEDIQAAFEQVQRIQQQEGRVVVHPFDSPWMVLGAADVALEFAEQAGRLDVLVVGVGGGGLCAGSAAAMKVVQPECAVYGVEPSGADTMARSIEVGEPQRLQGTTVADSLAAPYASARTLQLCRALSRGIVRVEDAEILDALRTLFSAIKLAVEPAAAAALAGVRGPLRDQARLKRVGIVLCGSNIDPHAYAHFIQPNIPRSQP